MSSVYSGGFDNIPTVADGDPITSSHANLQTDAINAIEATLGLDPGDGVTVAEGLAGKLDQRGGIMSGDIAMDGHSVTDLAEPSSAGDAATKSYVDTQVAATNPMTAVGDMVVSGTSGVVSRLAGDTSDARKFLREQSVSGVAQAPEWDSLQAGDIPTLSHSKISDFDTQVRSSRLDQMASPTTDVSMGNCKLTNVALPVSDMDAATKQYVDSNTSGINPMTSQGDTLYGGTSGALDRLPGDTSNTRKFLREQSVSGVAQAPAWDTLQAGDIPDIAESQVTSLTTHLAALAPVASPALTGTPTAPTPAEEDSSTRIATTAFVDGAVSSGLDGYATQAWVNGQDFLTTVPSSVTQQGNTFNGTSELVQLTSAGKLPALDGSLLTGMTASQVGADAAGAAATAQSNAASYTDTAVAAINPMTAAGDLIYGGAAGAMTHLTGDTSNTRKFLREQSVSDVAQVPAWDTLQAGDIPDIAESQVTSLTTHLAALAPVASPALTGTPTAPTPAEEDSSTRIATTAFVDGAVSSGLDGYATQAWVNGQDFLTTVPSSVTQQGNTFNGTSELVQLTSAGKLPALDGSLLTGMTASQVGADAAGAAATAQSNAASYTDTRVAAINPMTSLGDFSYGASGGTPTRLAANTATRKKFITEKGTGTAGNAPSWGTINPNDLQDIYGTTTGTGSSYAVTLSFSPTSLPAGMVVLLRFNVANTGACTLNVNSLGATAIKNQNGDDPAAGTLKGSGVYLLAYDGAHFQIVGFSMIDMTAVAAIRLDQLAAPTSDLAMNSCTLTGLRAPTGASEAATKAYVDAVAVVAPTGTITMYGGSSAPSGWVLCDGSSYDGTVAQYQALWGVLQNLYGGSSQSSFNVPDLRGRVAVGAGTAQGASGATNHALGTSGGEEKHTLTTNEMPSHGHSATDSGHTHDSQIYDGSIWLSNGGTLYGPAYAGGSGQHNTGSGTASISVGLTGGGYSHNTMPPYTTINYIIKL